MARDLTGYAGVPPHPRWPGDARVAVQFVLNVEAGAERTLVNNDARYLLLNGFATGDDFLRLLTDAFAQLRAEGGHSPKLMSVGLHGRISGHPACARALARFLDHVQRHERVWVCRREEVARHWQRVHPG